MISPGGPLSQGVAYPPMPIDPAQLSILRYPAPVLRARAKTVAKIDDEVRGVVERMIELMKQAEGIGLAATQVGLPWRIFVTNIPEQKQVKVYINPKLSDFGKTTDVYEEGCLSLPGIHVDVARPTSATLTAQDLDGREVTVRSEGFPARVWQHEFDHLNGVLIIDHIPPSERKAMRQTMKMKSAAGG